MSRRPFNKDNAEAGMEKIYNHLHSDRCFPGGDLSAPISCANNIILPDLGISGALRDRLHRLVLDNWNGVEKAYYFEGKRVAKEYLAYCVTEARDYTKRVSELSELFGVFLTKDELDIENWKNFYLCVSDTVISQYKKMTVYYLDIWLEQALPDFSVHDLLERVLPRRLYIKLRHLVRGEKKNRPRVQQLLYTLIQGFKKSLMPMKKKGIIENLIKHKEALTRTPPSLSEEVLDCIDRVCEKLVIDKVTGVPTSGSQLSRKSTIESTFANAGSLGYIQRMILEDRSSTVTASGGTVCLRDSLFQGYSYVRNVEYLPVPLYSSFDIDASEFHYLAAHLRRRNLSEYPSAKPYCILEPLKARIITKPKVTQYLGLKAIQKRTWEKLRSFRQFTLIGEPVAPFHVAQLQDRWMDGELWVSGDYSAATDNLNMEVTLRICKNIYSSQDPEVYELCKRALVGSEFCYNFAEVIPRFSNDKRSCLNALPKLGKPDMEFTQTNGQFMGSVLSFPILCIANYAAFHLALERDAGKQLPVFLPSEKPVLINGDDILFSANPRLYSVWLEAIKEFGFEPSPGKNLFCKDYSQINSVLFQMDPEFGLPKSIPFLNLGMITGRRKQECSYDWSVGGWDGSCSLQRFCSIQQIYRSIFQWDMDPCLKLQGRLLFAKHNKWLFRTFHIGMEHLENPDCRVEDGIRSIISERDPFALHKMNNSIAREFPELKLVTDEFSDGDLIMGCLTVKKKLSRFSHSAKVSGRTIFDNLLPKTEFQKISDSLHRVPKTPFFVQECPVGNVEAQVQLPTHFEFEKMDFQKVTDFILIQDAQQYDLSVDGHLEDMIDIRNILEAFPF